MGGGSGGHVTPVVAVLNELAKLPDTDIESVRFVCDRGFAEQAAKIMESAHVPLETSIIMAGKLRRYRQFRFVDYITTPSVVGKNILDLGKIAIGFLQSLWLIWRYKPDVMFAKGGFVCLPVGWAARVLRVPIVIHDSDARPGLTNRLLASFAKTIATGFPLDYYPYPLKKSKYVGVPIREGYKPVSAAAQRSFKAKLNVPDGTLLVVAFGGGLGSQAINTAMLDAAPMLKSLHTRAVLISGVKHYDIVKQAAESMKEFTVLEFVSEGMAQLLAAADVVVTRASATSLQELAGLAKPVIAVPARQLGDQHKNAELFTDSGAAVVLQDEDLAHGILKDELQVLLKSSDMRKQLSEKIHRFARPDAAKQVALLIKAAGAKKGNLA